MENTIVKQLVDMTVNVMLGEVDPLEAFIKLKEIEKAFTLAKKEIQDSAIVEAQKHGAKTFSFKGATITLKDNPGRWVFKGYNEWVVLDGAVKDIEAKMKVAHSMSLKGGQYIEEGTGEVIPPAQYINGSEGISVTLDKEA